MNVTDAIKKGWHKKMYSVTGKAESSSSISGLAN